MIEEEGQFLVSMVVGRKKPSFCAYIILSISLLTSFNLAAQKNWDPGIFVGTSYYLGDLNSSTHFAMPSFAGGAILRYNFNSRNSLRAHAIYHSLKGENNDLAGYYSSVEVKNLNASFVDLGFQFEFNWWPYKTAFRKTKMSPYVFAGLGYDIMILNRAPVVAGHLPKSHITMPFGLGYKINVGEWLSAGAEIGPRKTFSDKLDGVQNPDVGNVLAPFGNNDWYVFTGVIITYKFMKFWDRCPTYDDI